tara:strand:+ start:605 stop:856 length:252 start_codon:yes stop_codon:yes gene_type:complete
MSTASKIIPNESLALDDFIPLPQFVERHPQIWRNLASARHAIFNADTNGLNEYGCIVKRANRIMVVKPRVAKWLAGGTLGKSA